MHDPDTRTDPVPELKKRIIEAEHQTQQATNLASALTDRQFRWREADDTWSVGQCLVHLATATEMFLERADAAVAEARAKGWTGSGPYRGTLFGRLFLWLIEPPPKLRMTTFENLEPPAGGSRDEVMTAFLSVQDHLVESMRRADGVDLGKARVASPMSELLRWSVGQCFEITLAHNRRHLQQAESVVAHPDFPRDDRPAPRRAGI